MKKDSTHNTSQDHDRKHGQDHIANNPRAEKMFLNKDDTADILAEQHSITKNAHEPAFKEDKRQMARQEHTSHFTNRAKGGEK